MKVFAAERNMDTYFAFTDECGEYQHERSDKFIRTHPFYVRSTVIMSLADYLRLQKGMKNIKTSFEIKQETEVKWSHYGSALKNNYSKLPHHLAPDQLKDYYKQSLLLLCTLESVTIYYTLTDNKSIGRVNEIALLKMHLQNAYQRVQKFMQKKDGFAIVIADDLNDKTKVLKQAVYELTSAGDYYMEYTNVKKGLYIDFSSQCHGLQIADICAGVFTAALKYESADESEQHKYECGNDLLFSNVYKKVYSTYDYDCPPYQNIYKSGIKEVPNNAGTEIAKRISSKIRNHLYSDLEEEFRMYDNSVYHMDL